MTRKSIKTSLVNFLGSNNTFSKLSILWLVLLGNFIANRLIQKYKEWSIILPLPHNGDLLLAIAYLSEYRKINPNKQIVIITDNSNNPLTKYFPSNYDRIEAVGWIGKQALYFFLSSKKGKRFIKINANFIYLFPSGLSRIKELYGIQDNSKPSRAVYVINGYVKGLRNNGLKIDRKTIIINPYAFSCDGVPISFFDKIAEYFRTNGYEVITSIFKKQKPLNNTIGIEIQLNDSIELFNACMCVIGIRSGFLDLAACSSVKIVSIDNGKKVMKDEYLLEKCWQREGIRTFSWSLETENSIFHDIVSYLIEENSEDSSIDL